MAVTGALGTRVYISSTLPITTTPHYSEDAYRKDVLATPFPSVQTHPTPVSYTHLTLPTKA